MKSAENFELLFEKELKPLLEPLEKRRKSFLNKFIPGFILVNVAIVVAVFVFEYTNILIGILLLIAAWFAFRRLFRNFQEDYAFQYKTEVVSKMIHFVDPKLVYSPEKGITPEEFQQSYIFPETIHKYISEDSISGMIGETAIAFAEIHAQRRTPDSGIFPTYDEIFRGLFFVADFNKKFTSRTIVVPDFFGDAMGSIGRFIQKEIVWQGADSLIKLEDPEFENHFAVYGSDQVEARYLLSPALMVRITQFRKENGYIWLSFANGNLYLALPLMENLFEPRIFRSVLTFKPMKKYFRYVTLMVSIVEELNLNARVWSK